MAAFVICHDKTSPRRHLEEFASLDEAERWIDEQLIVVEGVGQRTRKMYRIIVGEEIIPAEPTA